MKEKKKTSKSASCNANSGTFIWIIVKYIEYGFFWISILWTFDIDAFITCSIYVYVKIDPD